MHTLTNANGLILRAIDRGATLTELHTPDRDGNLADILLGLASPADYEHDSFYLGTIVGRCANRIAKGRFTLDGETYTLATNNPPNHLHGGPTGFSTRIWNAVPASDPRGNALSFEYRSEPGEEGYPGALTARTTYILTDANELIVEMTATTDASTLCNLAQHAYWNLAGHDSGTILDHELTLAASRYTPVDDTSIPTGELAPVDGTPFDFQKTKPIGRDFDRIGNDPAGYDHNLVVDGDPLALRPVATVHEPNSGRVMTLASNQPGVQLYTGNFLDGSARGKAGATYPIHTGFCLETQHHPDAINNPAWPQPVLRPGETYRHTMVFTFTTDRDEA